MSTQEQAAEQTQAAPPRRRTGKQAATEKAVAATGTKKTTAQKKAPSGIVAEEATTANSTATPVQITEVVATVQQDLLLEAVEAAIKAVPLEGKENLIDRLVLTTNQENQTLTLRGFNLVIGIESTIPANVITSDTWNLSGSKLLTLIRNFPTGAVTLTWSAGKPMTVTSKTAGPFELATKVDSPPAPPTTEKRHRYQLDANTRWGLETAIALVGTENYRCVHLRLWNPVDNKPDSFAGVTLTSVFKEGAALVFYNNCPEETDLRSPDSTVSIAGDSLRKLIPFLESAYWIELGTEEEEPVVQFFTKTEKIETVFTARTDQVSATDVLQYRPANTLPFEITVDREQLSKALYRQAVITSGKTAVTISLSQDELTLSSTGEGIGSGTDQVSAQIKGDGETEIKFNADYLLLCLKQIESNQVRLSFSAPSRPVYIRDCERTQLFILLMPAG